MTSAARSSIPTTATCSTWSTAGSSAPARAAWRCAAATRSCARPGTRTLWLDDFDLSDETWASFGIPIGLAFFIDSSASGGIVALYPSPAGATESELEIEAWRDLRGENPVLMGLEPDAEALIVNRIAEPPEHAIAPIDECYRLVGMIKLEWDGISGGAGVERAIETFFGELRERAAG